MYWETQQLFEGLLGLIQEWKPKEYLNEKQYEEDLYNYLYALQQKGIIKKDRLIKRQRGRERIDIVLDDIVGIEIKKDLKRQPEIDRCYAQLKRMKKEYDFIILVIVGKNNSQEHISLLKHELKDIFQPDFIGNQKYLRIIEIKH